MKINYLFIFSALWLFTQSCALHKSEALYKRFKYEQIKAIEVQISDSVNGPLLNLITIDSTDLLNNNSLASLVKETFDATKKYNFKGLHYSSAYLNSPDTNKKYLLIRIIRDKDVLGIWPYHNYIDFTSHKGDALIYFGRIYEFGTYSSGAVCPDAYFSNKYINMVNGIIEYENKKPSLDNSNKSKKQIESLPLIKE